MDKIAVLIPCYNESKTVEKVVSDFRRVLPDATVYVYDNNSTDGTAELAAGAGAVVRHEYQQGKGNVMRRMFREIDAEAYILVDGDDTYPAEAAPEMVARIAQVIGGADASKRATPAASIIAGLFFTRYILKLESVASMSPRDVVSYHTPAMNAAIRSAHLPPRPTARLG